MWIHHQPDLTVEGKYHMWIHYQPDLTVEGKYHMWIHHQPDLTVEGKYHHLDPLPARSHCGREIPPCGSITSQISLWKGNTTCGSITSQISLWKGNTTMWIHHQPDLTEEGKYHHVDPSPARSHCGREIPHVAPSPARSHCGREIPPCGSITSQISLRKGNTTMWIHHQPDLTVEGKYHHVDPSPARSH